MEGVMFFDDVTFNGTFDEKGRPKDGIETDKNGVAYTYKDGHRKKGKVTFSNVA